MNSAFSEDILADKLAKLNNTQQCIETLSHWCIYHRKNAEQIVQTWDKQFHSSSKEQKVPFLYLSNDILQNSKRNGTEFVEEFWKVLPGALKDVTENGDDHGKKVASRLVDIWQERRVFGSRARGIKDVMLGAAPLPALDMTKRRSHSSGIKIVKRDSRSVKLRLGVGGTAEKIVTALHTVQSELADEDADLETCKTSMRHVGKMEKDVDSACSKAEDPRREVLCAELKDEEANMKKCIEKLKVVEANRAAVVSELKETLQEQESELEKVRTQLQLAEAMVHEASNMQRKLKNEPTIPLPKSESSVEPGKAFPNGQVKEQQKTAAAILADKIAASSNSQQILQSALSKFAAEEAKNSSETRSDKRQKTDQPLQVPSAANAAAFVPMPQVVATTAQQQPQAILVQQAPMQSQAPAPQPQYNIYQAPQQFVQQPGGVMMAMPYNMSTMTPPPPPPPQMMNLGRPSPSSAQPQMAIMPQTQPPAPPMLQQQMPMSLAPQMQFALQQPGVPFRPMQPPPGMQYFHPQSQ
ncbi:Regulation of nuclear pre-mRNA domain-containing protein 1B [Dichanthelium oligosanthes]|uniref:Regulation of nuclear pre-mRNA domain-containing protein 1B n=1 Tax=Dichanthelium oligosanthes TaxID=888268 RepID=A0A1E5ULE6_9POAL|nr:Regulation of nuclear pre-mRNA domain-containing protein 1B [Dichanthelium oligosanthes]